MPQPELAQVIPISSPQSEDTSNLVMERMLAAIPTGPRYDRDRLQECIESTQAVTLAATACADACLAEEMVEELTDCVRTLLTAADICEVTTRVLSRRCGSDPVVVRALVTACWTACRTGREVCDVFPSIHRCRACATACRSAERACRALLTSLQ